MSRSLAQFRRQLTGSRELIGLVAKDLGAGFGVVPMAQTHYLLDAHEAAQILRMDRRTLVRWARLGQVPAHPMGEGKRKLWRFVEHELLQWVEARGISSERRPPASTIETAINAHARRTA